ncbi:unnamed protein product, partial [Mesorhabditis belari]|uniref:Peroxin-19 n=1 Tax=Mesorhabditis belari TaxID=2138241 RepID=A0AAF3EAD9_9BILA
MSEEKQTNDHQNDKELADLLDSSLKDFGKTRTTDDELDEMMASHDQEAAKRAASDFQMMLQQMMSVQEEAMKAQGEGEVDGASQEMPEDARMFFNAMEQLIERSGAVANAQNTQEMVEGLEALRGPDSELEPFMAMLMQTLASKEVMYPSLKEIFDAYPKYFEEHSAEIDAPTKERYEKQREILGRICEEFEKEPNSSGADEAEAADKPDQPAHTDEHIEGEKGFEEIGKLLIELQALGYPPKELVGTLPPGWATDDTGMPKVEDMNQAAGACNLM